MSESEEPKAPLSESEEAKAKKKKIFFRDLMITFLVPTLIGKGLMVFWGGYYTEYPGEGWGYLFAFAIIFTVFNLVRFAWKHRHYGADED